MLHFRIINIPRKCENALEWAIVYFEFYIFFCAFFQNESLLGEENVKLAELKLQHERMEKYGNNTPDIDRLNISEEVNRTAIWLQVRRDSMPMLDNGISSTPHRYVVDDDWLIYT